MVPIISSEGTRLCLINARETLQRHNINWKEKTLAQSFIRSEVAINANNSTYQFGVINNQNVNGNNPFASERRMKQQDVFFVSHIGYFLNVQASPAGNTSYQYSLQTFPPVWMYGAAGVNLDLLKSLWTNASLNITVNDQVIVDAWDCFRHFMVPETQYPYWITPPNQYSYFDEIDGSQSGFYPVEPNWVFNGAFDVQVFVNFQNSLSTAGIGGASFRLVTIYRGIVAQNCSNIIMK